VETNILLDFRHILSRFKSFCNRFGDLINAGRGQSGQQCVLLDEIRLWKEKWLRSSKNPSVAIRVTVEEALQNCDEDLYSLVNSLLSILLTLPVSLASVQDLQILNLFTSLPIQFQLNLNTNTELVNLLIV